MKAWVTTIFKQYAKGQTILLTVTSATMSGFLYGTGIQSKPKYNQATCACGVRGRTFTLAKDEDGGYVCKIEEDIKQWGETMTQKVEAEFKAKWS